MTSKLNDRVISWNFISQLYDIESPVAVAMRLAPKLTHKHVTLPPFSKMKVKTAAQVFSHYVYSATFIKNVDSMFDAFNNKKITDVKLFRCAMKKDSPAITFLKFMKSSLDDNLQVIELKTQPPCMKGWQLSIHALLMLRDEVSSLPGITYLCTHKINQDPLENCFSAIRAKGGYSDNPDTKKFTEVSKQVLLKACLSQSELSNCETDVNAMLIDVFSHKLPVVNHNISADADEAVVTLSEAHDMSVSDNSVNRECFVLCGWLCSQEIFRKTWQL